VPGPEALRHQEFDRPADQFFAQVTEEFFCLGVDDDDAPLRINDHHGVRSRFQQPAEFLFHRAGRGFIGNIFGDQKVAGVQA
jgi:hypothetical protein